MLLSITICLSLRYTFSPHVGITKNLSALKADPLWSQAHVFLHRPWPKLVSATLFPENHTVRVKDSLTFNYSALQKGTIRNLTSQKAGNIMKSTRPSARTNYSWQTTKTIHSWTASTGSARYTHTRNLINYHKSSHSHFSRGKIFQSPGWQCTPHRGPAFCLLWV